MKPITHEWLTFAQKDLAGCARMLKVTLKLGEAEIPVLPAHSQTAEELLEALAGCLGQESVQAYDFDLKLGGYLLKNPW